MGIYLHGFVGIRSFLPISWVFQVYIGNLLDQIQNLVSKLIFIYYVILLDFISGSLVLFYLVNRHGVQWLGRENQAGHADLSVIGEDFDAAVVYEYPE